MAEDLVVIGVILGAFGVKGEVRIKPFTEEPAGVRAYGPLLDQDGAPLFEIHRLRTIKGGILAAATRPLLTREAAEALKGTLLHVPRRALPAPDPDDFYIIDLVGCRAESPAGETLGVVAAVHNFGAGDVLEVRDRTQTAYFAFSHAVVPVVDLAGRRIVIDAPEEIAPPEAPE